MEQKTNVMRILEQKKINYKSYRYPSAKALSGEEVAKVLSQDPGKIFKTLVTMGRSKQYYVFVIPANCALNLKKAAATVSEKSIEMIKSKELLPLTGYVHGGCSPIGMKKTFPTVLHISAETFESIIVSGGKIGSQVEISPDALYKLVKFQMADVADMRQSEEEEAKQ
ncbi:MAG: Cys-tRNA(Pro) deacylase [Anaerovoracaceae bacterium]